MFSCPLCDATYTKRKDVDSHLNSVHPDTKSPYGCTSCSATFSSQKAQNLHVRKQHTSMNDESGQKRQRITDCPFVGSLGEWVHARYNTTRLAVEQLGDSTIARIEAFSVSLRFENDQTLTQVLEMEECFLLDSIDVYVDADLETNSSQTTNNHLRYLKILLLFYNDHLDMSNVEDTVIEYITDLVADTQAATTRANTTLNMLKLEDPFALAQLRDELVNALLKEQVEHIHPYILNVILNEELPTAKHVDFGVRLRNWLELAIRYTNIPCRIQCTRELKLENDLCQNYVCKLVLRENMFCRMINQDKVGSSHQPLLIPLGSMLSAYLHFYITRCRPDTADHGFVFCTRRGAKWIRPSQDLKIYIDTILGIPVHSLDPSGRFIHASRAIMMGVFAIGVEFDQQKMHGFARLLRHSSTTNEKYYSMWQHRALSNQAIDVFSDLMGIRDHATSPSGYIPVKLRDVPARMMHSFLREFGTSVTKMNVVPCYGTRSIGTQTISPSAACDVTDSNTITEIELAETQPKCSVCGKFSLDVYGPFGAIRRKRYFGRYFLACACFLNGDGRFDLKKCLWYPLGCTPLQKSKSSRPRNMTEIQNFIALELK